MAYAYKQLGTDDVSVFHGMLRMFGEAFHEQLTYQAAIPSAAYLDALLAKPHVIALAALAGDEVVGGLVAYVLEKFERERSEVYIYDLAVAEAHRRKGIARRLIEMLRGIAKEKRAYVVYVQADYGDDAAIALYASLGEREEVLHFDIPVE